MCPDELKEAISSLLYAASRCGEFPELQEIRAVLTSRFGKEFASNAIELRNNCGVNHKVYYDLENLYICPNEHPLEYICPNEHPLE